MLPLSADGTWIGAIIYRGGDGSRSAERNLASLASAAALAIRTAQLQSEREHLMEELATSAQCLTEMQDELARQKALASVGQMAAGAGHELNNPLAVISGRSELLAHDEQDPKRREALELIHTNAQRVSAIITGLMDFAQPAAPKPETVDLAKLIGQITGPLANDRIEVEIEADDDIPPALADEDQLRRALTAIVDNARQSLTAEAPGRRVSVSLREPALADAATVELIITDTGVGMPSDALSRATDPFFSARPAGRGRGMGLAMARRLIEHNGGRLTIESAEGQGTAVRVQLPPAPT
jgi:signal transduction histidine kinase